MNIHNAVFVLEEDKIILHALERCIVEEGPVDVEVLIIARGLHGVLEAAVLVDIIE